jgi:hypothetical protein
MDPYNRLFHIEIESKADLESFIGWMNGMDQYPFSIYLGGKTFSFANFLWKDLWMCGFEAALDTKHRYEF